MAEHTYWDTNCFLSWLNGEPERAPVLEALLDLAERGERSLVTSTLTLVEVVYAPSEQTGAPLDESGERAIDALFERALITFVDVHEGIARQARRLMRDAIGRGWSLGHADAVHLASAWAAGVEAFHTYDRALFKYRNILPFPIGNPVHEDMTRLSPKLPFG